MLQPSLLERLTDEAPELNKEPHSATLRAPSEYKRSVARDLQNLLNTTCPSGPELFAGWSEVPLSMVAYGLPDMSTCSFGSHRDHELVAAAVQRTISLFEPRLRHVRVFVEGREERFRALKLRVEADLDIPPDVDEVVYDATVDFLTFSYEVGEAS
jgi:type VI secretion system protein ImpF